MKVVLASCRFLCAIALGLPIASTAFAAEPAVTGDLRLQPSAINLNHPRAPHSVLVSATTADGLTVDLTAAATFASADDKIAAVDSFGLIRPVASGKTTITITAAGKTATLPVAVELPAEVPQVSFRHEVMPVFSRGGCNMGACHGYSLGKNGFKLSLRGGDEAADYESLIHEFLGRRLNRQQPEMSLLLRKGLGEVAHRGGVRMETGDAMHETLLAWIRAGAPGDLKNPVQLTGIEVFPAKMVGRPGQQQQLQLIAKYSDGSQRDVSRLGVYTSNGEAYAPVDEAGVITAKEVGETAIVIRYERIFTVCNVVVLVKTLPDFVAAEPPAANLIDRHVVAKLNDLKITPADLCTDAEFLRRVTIDLIGAQPTPTEMKAFLADPAPDKRGKVVDALLARPDFVDHWALKWGDLLQNSRTRLSEPAMWAFREWIRSAVAANMPLDEFARKLLTSKGSWRDDPAAAFFLVSSDTNETVQRATQVFCGVRMLCAKCHNHPFENWTQADYYGLASFFNQVTSKPDPSGAAAKDGKAKVVTLNLAAGNAVNSRTNAGQLPRFLGGSEAKIGAGDDRREAYAKWLTAPENPFFAKSLANRIWSYFFHRGIIDPVDDLRSTNPPTNPALLDALTKEFVANKFDARQLMRTIVLSRTYQRSTTANATNAHDVLNFSRAVPRRLKAEVLVDAIAQATGIPESFAGAPAGFRAVQLPDSNIQSPLLSMLGKPMRLEACECERSDESNMLQALEFINGKSVLERVARAGGRVDTLLKQPKMTDEQMIEELFWWTVCRPPTEKEIALATAHFKDYEGKRNEAAQDLMWTLLNTKDFLFNR
ncbi:hypothetical protein AYO44_02170 [Planctomycetaceae bacterium SCGC AG-212-F19]|nr:hypothetical protein AYO44_02170 [Planctomycetaceae bacterium SCGC AG-212-F19]